MTSRREEILSGVLSFPKQIMDIVNPTQNENIQIKILEFWDSIWHNYLQEKSCNTIVWFDKIDDKHLFNLLLMHLSKAGWITSCIENNYAFILLNESKLEKWVTKEELINVKFRYKFIKYRLTNSKSTWFNKVKINGKYKETGLVRKGFMKAGNNTFKYDTEYLKKYLEPIAINVQKGLTNSTKDITYQEIINELLNYYSIDDSTYTLGNCLIDSRGRAIYQCTRKVFNPISCKIARALLICKGEELTVDGMNCVFAFIAELLSYRGKDIQDKIAYGQSMYITRTVPSIEEMEALSNYDELHVLIWLERIYKNLDEYETTKCWYIPIDLDAIASMLQMVGVLTNDYKYMLKTNLIDDGTGFKDIWVRPYVSRTHVKKAMTPQLYGSGKNAKELWDNNKLEYTTQQFNKMNEDLNIGIYANANNFKNFIINNVKPKEIMEVVIRDEKFTIECNRFKWEETTQKQYYIYTSSQELLKKVVREVNLVPDCEQFKRFFVTLLLHGIDSQVADFISNNVKWVLSVHDSFIVHPNDCINVRELYTSCMYDIWLNRDIILKNYFKSIGIEEKYEGNKFELGHTIPITKFSHWCLK